MGGMKNEFTDRNVSDDFDYLIFITVKEEKKSKKTTERVSVSTLQIDKLENVLLYILERCAGKPNVGETFSINCFISPTSIIMNCMKNI